jgi:hypothetical protein
MVRSGHHVALFEDWVNDQTMDRMIITHAHSGTGLTVAMERGLQNYVNLGFTPRVYNNLKDTPLAIFSSFEALREGSEVHIRWSTVDESHTRSFVLCRSGAPAEGFRPVSSEIDVVNGNSGGASYEVVDVALPSGQVYYRLLEYEKGGCAVWHKVTAAE